MPDAILVADDEPDILTLTKMILETEGYEVICASNGDDAISQAKSERPDAIVLDLVMPGKSGLEVCKYLKSEDTLRHIPVIIFTVLGRDVDRKLTANAGADSHFLKPFTPDELLREIRTQLNLSRMNRFSRQLKLEHEQTKGKKILLEFDPSEPYERLVRDFVHECVANKETCIVLTRAGLTVEQAVKDIKGIEIIRSPPEAILSSILQEHRGGHVNIAYDSLTDLIFSAGVQSAYGFVQNALSLLNGPGMTALFLINSSAHEEKAVYSLRGLFSDQLSYGKQGMVYNRSSHIKTQKA